MLVLRRTWRELVINERRYIILNEELKAIWLSFFNWVMGNGPRPENEVLPPEPPPALPFTQRPEDEHSRFHEATLKERYDLWLETHGLHLFSVVYSGLSVLTCIVIVSLLLAAVSELPPFAHELNSASSEVIHRYVQQGGRETGSQNLVSGILSGYRAFDSLGAYAVLFTSITSVLMLLGTSRRSKTETIPMRPYVFRKNDTVISAVSALAAAVTFMLGCSLIINGHLSPGGGFSGGALISIALMFMASSYGFGKIHAVFGERTFIASLTAALSVYALSQGWTFFTGANHIASFIPKGTLGEFLSAGLILPLNICTGIISACTLYGFYALFSEGDI